jgi:hypothetical protein
VREYADTSKGRKRRALIGRLSNPIPSLQVGIKKGKEREREGREEREATRTQRAAREKGVLETTRRCVSKMITERSDGRKGRRAGAGRARSGRGEGGEVRKSGGITSPRHASRLRREGYAGRNTEREIEARSSR